MTDKRHSDSQEKQEVPRTVATPGGLDAAALVEQGYKLVRAATDRYRRAGNRLARARKSLAAAEQEHRIASVELKRAIAAVQPTMPPVSDDELAGQL